MLGRKETGNETYIDGLLEGFSYFDSINVAAVVDPNFNINDSKNSIEHISLRKSSDWLRLSFGLPRICRQWKADILHTTYIAPIQKTCLSVVSVHDVSYKRFPEYFSPRDRLLLNTLIPITLQRADAVITISEYSKNEILSYYPDIAEKLHVIYLAPKPYFRSLTNHVYLNQVKRKINIRDNFILFVGNLQPRKNLIKLIQAFSRIRDKINGIQLVIVGAEKWRSSSIHSLVYEQNLENDVIFTGYLTDDDLVALYNLARVFIYPSLYEGFGLPILEAMACGTPVICSNTSSMPEVAGEAAMYIDPNNEKDIALALLEIIQDDRLAHSLSSKGKLWVNEFSWAKTAMETSKIYNKIS